jgi:phage terminase large subunit GpA-like protein
MVAIVEKFTVLPIQPEEESVLKARTRPAFIDWMENNYYLTGGTSAVEGLWSREYTPYFVPIAAYLDDTTTREVWIYACSQSGKSTFGTGFTGYITDCMPGPTMEIMPTKDDVKNRIEARIRPMFAANESLLAHVRGHNVNNIFIGKQTVMDHMILYIGWATTAEAMADKPVCYVKADETGKYPPYVGEEADPISLLRKRQRWFKDRSKFLAMTTPVTAGDMSDQNWQRGDCCQWWAPCQHCGKWHEIKWENVKIDRYRDNRGKWRFYAESVYSKGGRARYACPRCGTFWSEDDRWNTVCRGKFVPDGCSVDDTGRITGTSRESAYKSCRIHALMLHPMVETVTNLVCEFVNAQKQKEMGNIQPLKDFWNSQLARPWRQTRAETDIERLKTHIGSYAAQIVPVGVELLTAGLDVQKDHLFLRVLGWGYLGEFWSIFEQRIETGPTDRLDNLEKVIPFLTRRWPAMEGKDIQYRTAAAAIDRGYNTEEVDALCVKYIGTVNLIPVAGDDTVKKRQWRTGYAAGGRIKRYDLNVTSYKDALFRSYFESTVPGPGYGHLHKDTQYEVLEHLTAEHKVIETKGNKLIRAGWKLKKEGRANHYWDCDVYARAAAEIAGLWSIPGPEAGEIKGTPVIGRPVGTRKIRTKY